MKKILFALFIVLVILHSKTTIGQEGNPFHASLRAQQVYSPNQANPQSVYFDPDDIFNDITDDNFNDRGRKYFSFQNVAFATSYLAAHLIYNHFVESNLVTLNIIALKSPLFILNRVFRI